MQKKLINEDNRLLSGSKTIASLTCKLNFEKCNMFLICAQEKQLTLINSSLSKIQCSRCHLVPFNVITIQLTSLQTASTHQLIIITLNRYLGQYYSCVAWQPRLLISLLFQQKFYSITKTCWKNKVSSMN